MGRKNDELFKEVFSRKDEAAELIQKLLPSELVSRIDLSTLELDNTSYVSPELKKFYSDLVYRIDYTGEEFTRKINLALLFDHKSKVPKYPHFQLLKYMLRIWETNIKQQKPLQVVIPVIVYNGKSKWQYRTLFESFDELDDFLKGFIPQINYLLVDLSILSYDQIVNTISSVLMQICLVAMRYIYDEKALQRIVEKLAVLGAGYFATEEGGEVLITVLTYLFSGATRDRTKAIIVDSFEKNVKDGGIMAKSILEKVELETEIKVAKKMVEEGFDNDMIIKITSLPIEEIQKLRESGNG